MIRKIRKIVIITLITIVVLVGMLLGISFLFGDQITDYVIKTINKSVNTEIKVKSTRFSIFRRFPNAAVVFEEVEIKSAKGFRTGSTVYDNLDLIRAKRLYTEINIFKIVFKDYSVKRIVIEDGSLNLIINSKGQRNFDIFKSREELDQESKPLKLSHVFLKNMRYAYVDLSNNLDINGLARRLILQGQLHDANARFFVSGNLLSFSLKVNHEEYLRNKSITTDITIVRSDNNYSIVTNTMKLESVPLSLVLNYISQPKNFIDLTAEVKSVNLSRFPDLLPDEYKKIIEPFDSKGQTNIKLTIQGNTSAGRLPHVELSFSLSDGTIVQKETNVKLNNISCAGRYSNGGRNNASTSSFEITNFKSSFGKGSILGNFRYSNFNQPKIDIDVKSDINLADMQRFLTLDTVETLSGSLKANAKIQMNLLNAGPVSRETISGLILAGNVKLVDGSLKLKNSMYSFSGINGEVELGNDFKFENFSIKVDNNDFFIRGNLFDAVPYLLKQNNNINLKAEVRSQNLDLSKYFERKPQKASSQKYDASLLFPSNLTAELNVSISHFTLKKLQARNVLARVNYKPGMYTLNSVILETMRGKVSGNGAVVQDANKNLIVKGQTDMKDIDLKQLFYTFGNFGQNILQDKHLNGRIKGNVLVSCEWNSTMVSNLDAVLVESNLEITEGELVNFEPMLGLSRFIKVNELKDIRFSTLKNQVFIRHQQIIIPQMDISSNAFNITGSGVHNFDNHYVYKINVLLSELLARKARQAKKENDEFGIVEDDGLGKTRIPLIISGYNNDYKIAYDTKGAKDIIKESLQNQKSELKSIFKDEFGMFKNDTTVKTKPKQTRFKVEFDDGATPVKKEDTNKTNKKKKKTFEEEEGLQVEFEK